jgi:flavin reductase (DIM6/NTAB) family NADH-FMN oxidoreductase RutF
MTKTEIGIEKSYRLLNPGSVVLVSVGDGEEDNVFAVTWNMPLRKDPPMAAILSGKRHYSYPLIERSGELVLNVPDASIADKVLSCGSISGHHDLDKFAHVGLTREPSLRVGPPRVAEAAASLECRVCQVVDLGASSLLVMQILAAAASEEHCPQGEWRFDRGLELLHHMGGKRFCVSSRDLLLD